MGSIYMVGISRGLGTAFGILVMLCASVARSQGPAVSWPPRALPQARAPSHPLAAETPRYNPWRPAGAPGSTWFHQAPASGNYVLPPGASHPLQQDRAPQPMPAPPDYTVRSQATPRLPQNYAFDSQDLSSGWHPVRAVGYLAPISTRQTVSTPPGEALEWPSTSVPYDFWGLQISGWLQQGYTGNYGTPQDRSNGTVLFNDRSNDFRMNQLNLYVERPVLRDGLAWDLGGRVDFMVGSDARYLTVPGLERHQDRNRKWNGENKDYGLAIPQAYIELATPWLDGVSIKAGHFYSITGYERAAGPANFFYSHSYAFLYGEPFTLTGALATIPANDYFTFFAGYHNGWDSFDSNSDESGVLGGLRLARPDGRTSLTATFLSGMDVTNYRIGNALVNENRHFYSLVFEHQISDACRYVFQHDFGYQEDSEIVVNSTGAISFDTGKWYGINQYLIYDFNEELSAGLRAEWFRDQDHSRLGIPVRFNPGGPAFLGGNYVAVTGGLNWRPQSHITVRPEIRWDYSDLRGNPNAPGGAPSLRTFDDRSSSSQITAAVDVILFY